MIIVSQSKEIIVNMEKLEAVTVYDLGNDKGFRIIGWTTTKEDDCYGLGDYSTKERCKEIIHEIRNKFGEYLHRPGGPALLIGSVEVPEDFWVLPKVYDMPEV